MKFWILIGYLAFLHYMTELMVDAIEEEEWWLVIALVIATIGGILYYYSR